MAIVSKPNMNYGVWAEGGNIEIPSSEKVEQGWIIEKPLNETMNWLQNRQDRMLQYINQRGVPEWDVNTEYPTNAFVSRSGVIYKAISQNQDADPTLDQEVWDIAFVSYTDFVDYSEKIEAIENDEGYLSLYVSKASPVMTGVAKGVSYNDTTGVSGLGFDTTTPKIVNNGETVVEFGGGTNPKDVVTHEQLALAIQVFKVGSVYTTTVDENPSTTFGYGTWERFAEGRALVGFSSSVSNSIPEWVKVIDSTYGEYEHLLTIPEMPKHNHPIMDGDGEAGYGGRVDTGVSSSYQEVRTIGDRGESLPHNNVQPSIVVYFWKRTA